MKLRLIRKRPKFLPGGDIQQVNETAMTNSQPEGFCMVRIWWVIIYTLEKTE